MRHSPWPAVRTTLLLVGVPLACAMLPAIYTQNAQDAKDRTQQYINLSESLNDIKNIMASRVALVDQHFYTIDKRDDDFGNRISQLEIYKPSYKR